MLVLLSAKTPRRAGSFFVIEKKIKTTTTHKRFSSVLQYIIFLTEDITADIASTSTAMDSDQAANPPDTLGPHDSSSPMFSCFLDCCKPKKGITSQEADEDHVTLAMKNEELRAKEKGNEK